MRPPLIDMILSQILFWGIFSRCCIVAWKFYKSVDGRLRVLTIELFSSMAWLYGIVGVYYFLWDLGYFPELPAIWIRIIGNLPMFIIMFKFDDYLRRR